jgi:lysophospholipase L1-like esterase
VRAARWLLVPALLALFALAATCDAAPADQKVYVALGDSLSAGIGATRPASTAFVPLVHDTLGEGVALVNLGHGGDTSLDLIEHGHLDQATDMIAKRNNDGDATNDVTLVTLEIGGNDLLRLYFGLVLTGVCPDLDTALGRPECVDALERALTDFEPNLARALDALLDADPELTVVLLTLYDPFSGLSEGLSELAQLSLEGMPGTAFETGLNDIVRALAAARGLHVADVYPTFTGRAPELISGDFIHPNDAGYQVMADAVLAALAGE